MKYPNFTYEQLFWNQGLTHVAGLDEVGRGAFAGPVVTGAVIFQPNIEKLFSQPLFSDRGQKVFINDSKKLSPRQRLIANDWVKHHAFGWSTATGSVAKINKAGIVKATNFAFRSAVSTINNSYNGSVQYLLVDAFYIPYVRGLRVHYNNRKNERNMIKSSGRQLAITKGDTKSISVAAASIIAKVHRDKLMADLGKKREYYMYGWERNKGYGTKEHREALVTFGATKHHRELYIRKYY